MLQKAVVQKVPSPERHINTGFFGTSKPKGTTPTSTSLFFIQGVFHLFTVILFRTFHSFSCGNFVDVSFCTQIVLRNNAYSNVNISFRKFFTYGYFLSHCTKEFYYSSVTRYIKHTSKTIFNIVCCFFR